MMPGLYTVLNILSNGDNLKYFNFMIIFIFLCKLTDYDKIVMSTTAVAIFGIKD